jgi:hypothetical protein
MLFSSCFIWAGAVALRLFLQVRGQQSQVHGQRRHRRAQAVVQAAREQAPFVVPAGGEVAEQFGEFRDARGFAILGG